MARTKQHPTQRKPAAALCPRGHGASKGPRTTPAAAGGAGSDGGRRAGMRRAAAQKAADAIKVWAGMILDLDEEEAVEAGKEKRKKRRRPPSAKGVARDL